MVIYLEVLHDNIRLQDCFSVVLVTNWHVGCGQCSICRSIQQYIGSPALTQLHIFLACPFEAFTRGDGSNFIIHSWSGMVVVLCKLAD